MSNAFIQVNSSFIKDTTLSYKAKLVYCILRCYYDSRDPTNPIFLGVAKLSEFAQLSKTSVKQGLKELQEKGYIKREQRQKQTANTFILK